MFNPYLKEINLNTSKTIDEFRFENTDLTVPEFMAKINFLLTEGKGYYENITFGENNSCSVKLHCTRNATPAELALAKDLQITHCLEELNNDLQFAEKRLTHLNSEIDYVREGAVFSWKYRSIFRFSKTTFVTETQVEEAKQDCHKIITELKEAHAAGPKAVVDLMVKRYGKRHPCFTKIVVG